MDNPQPPDYVVRSWTPAAGRGERITFVDRYLRVMSVTITRRHALDGGAHNAIMARIAAAGTPRKRTR